MKILTSISVSLLIYSASFAQVDTVKLRDIEKNTRSIVTDRPPQAVYFQLGGSGPILSVNYDRRFSNKVNGLGFTAGLGFYSIFGVSIFSVPLSVNYLIGKSNSFLELAAGGTYASAQGGIADFSNSNNNNTSVFFFHGNVGYRYQPTKGGFFFRGGVSPLFAQGESVTWYYVGFGHNF